MELEKVGEGDEKIVAAGEGIIYGIRSWGPASEDCLWEMADIAHGGWNMASAGTEGGKVGLEQIGKGLDNVSRS